MTFSWRRFALGVLVLDVERGQAVDGLPVRGGGVADVEIAVGEQVLALPGLLSFVFVIRAGEADEAGQGQAEGEIG